MRSTSVSVSDAPTVLIVEDNADVRDYLKGHLDESYGIVEAENGVEGLKKTLEAAPDLVIADVMMPEMDGDHAVPDDQAG